MITREQYESLKAQVEKQLWQEYPEEFDANGYTSNTAISLLGSTMLQRLIKEANDEDTIHIE